MSDTWGRFGRFNNQSIIDRMMKKIAIDEQSGCWIWRGAIGSHKRYGVMGFKGKGWLAHRASWAVFNGPIPPKMCVCHKCDNTLCINPAHLFLGSQKDNVLDMESKGRSIHPKREKHGRAKLNWDSVDEIRTRHSNGESARSLARCFGVDKHTISSVVKFRTWATK